MENWDNETMTEFVKIIKQVVHDVLKEEGVPCYIPAIIHSVNTDGTANVYLPPDKISILHNKINKTGMVLRPGDSVELCCKKGRLGDAWIAIKHGVNPLNADGSGGGIVTNNYNELVNLPKINGVKITGNKTSLDLGIEEDKTFVYTQSTAAAKWTIIHNMNKYPSVTIVDNTLVAKIAGIQYIDLNTVQISFDEPFAGQAFLN